MTTVSQRATRIHQLPMYMLVNEARKMELEGKRIVNLAIGSTGGFHNEDLLVDLAEAARDPDMGYCASGGKPELREAIARLYSKEKGVRFGLENVAIAPANALITQVLTVLCDRGDVVYVPDPGFATYWLAGEFCEQKMVPYPLHEGRGWNPDVEEVKGLLDGAKGKALFLNTPSNPLGTVIEPELVHAILEECEMRSIPCIVDETYKNLIYVDRPHRFEHSPNALYLYSFSKDAAAAGMRVGCLVGPEEVIAKVNEFSSLFFSCQPPLFQDVVLRYLERGGAFHAILRREIPPRIRQVDAILRQSRALSYVVPNAAFYVFVNISRTGMSSDEFALAFLRAHNVCVCPGSAFGSRGRGYVRMTLSGRDDELMEACRRLVDFTDSKVREVGHESV